MFVSQKCQYALRAIYELAKELNVSEDEIVRWNNIAKLSKLKGMGSVHANILAQTGIEDIPTLATQDPSTLHSRLLNLYTGATILPPREAVIRVWIRAANKAKKNN